MLRIFAITAFLFAPFVAQAATSTAANKFVVSRQHDEAVQWYEANRAAVMQAANCRVLEDRGHGEYRVQTDTPAGACQYVIRETREQGTTADGRARTIYRISYIRNISGRLANQQLVITMTKLEGNTEIDMRMTTSVSGRFVPVAAVRRVQGGSLAGFEQFVTNRAR